MRVALVKPRQYLCDESSAGKPAFPKLGCSIFLAASYCKNLGFEAEVFNVPSAATISYDAFDVVVGWVPLYDGFYEGLAFLEKAKAKGKITIMILNDPVDAMEEEVMRRFSYVDFCVRLYEREFTLGLLLQDLSQKIRSSFRHPGLLYRQGERIINTGKSPARNDLTHLSSTAEFLRKEPLSTYREVFIEAGRGCPYGCTFCFYHGTQQRKRAYADIIDELTVAGNKVEQVWLHDLNMLINEQWVNGLCDALIAAGSPAHWGTDARLDECANLPLLKKMKRAGCSLLVFGIESADEEIIKRINKRVDFKLLDIALANCAAAGIRAELNIMYGFPWDNNATMRKTALFIRKYPVTCIMIVRPLRGTPLYDECKRLKIIQRDMTLDDYIHSKRYPAHPTLYLSRKQIYRWHRRFESIVSGLSFKRKIEKEGFIHAVCDLILLKKHKLLNPRKIIEHIIYR